MKQVYLPLLATLFVSGCSPIAYYIPPDQFTDPISYECGMLPSEQRFTACYLAVRAARQNGDPVDNRVTGIHTGYYFSSVAPAGFYREQHHRERVVTAPEDVGNDDYQKGPYRRKILGEAQ